MATYNAFDIFTLDLGLEKHDFSSDILKLVLGNVAPVAGDAVYDTEISATKEITSAGGYTVGGLTCTTASWSQSGGDAVLNLGVSDPTFTANAAVDTFRYAILYNSTPATNKPLIAWWDRGSGLTLANGETFTGDFDTATVTITSP